jgi:hypothetical protein
MDLGSAHGTFWAATRLAPHAPTPLPLPQPLPADDVFRFGASTRAYRLRDAPPDGSDVRDMTEYNKMVLARESKKRRLDADEAADADATGLDGRACKEARRLTVRFNDHVYEHVPTRTPAGPRFADVVQSVVIARKVCKAELLATMPTMQLVYRGIYRGMMTFAADAIHCRGAGPPAPESGQPPARRDGVCRESLHAAGRRCRERRGSRDGDGAWACGALRWRARWAGPQPGGSGWGCG